MDQGNRNNWENELSVFLIGLLHAQKLALSHNIVTQFNDYLRIFIDGIDFFII